MNLINNGMHSLEKALAKLFSLDNTEENEVEYILKDIIISFHHALETLFKYLIEQKSEYLIYENLKEYFDTEVKNIIGQKSQKTNDFQGKKKVKKQLIF